MESREREGERETPEAPEEDVQVGKEKPSPGAPSMWPPEGAGDLCARTTAILADYRPMYPRGSSVTKWANKSEIDRVGQVGDDGDEGIAAVGNQRTIGS